MRTPTKITRGYQFWYMIGRQLSGALICAIIQFFLFVGSYSNNIFRTIFGVLFVMVGFLIVFDSAAVLGKNDNKSYTPLKHEVKWSVLWGIVLAALSAVLIAVFKLNWQFNGGDGAFSTAVMVAINVIFYVLQSPYMAFTIVEPNHIPLAIMIIAVVLPIVASVLGYISGKKEFAISDKINSLMFEKTKKDT